MTEQNRFTNPWVRGVLFFAFMFLFTLFYLEIARPLVARLIGAAPFGSLWYVIVHLAVRLILPLAIWSAIFREKPREYIPHKPLGMTNFLYIAAMSFLVQPLAMAISGATALFFPNEMSEMVMEQTIHHPLWMMLLAMAVAPAVFEELAFRGYIQSTFRGLPLWITAAANGLLFSIMHQSPQQAGYTFVMGIFFVLIVHHSRSIMAGIISHFIINATQVTLMFSAGRAAEIMADVPTVEATSDMQLVVVAAMTFVAVFTTILTVVLYKRFVKENTPPIDEKNDTNDTNKGKERE